MVIVESVLLRLYRIPFICNIQALSVSKYTPGIEALYAANGDVVTIAVSFTTGIIC